jgi:hypothetical protein
MITGWGKPGGVCSCCGVGITDPYGNAKLKISVCTISSWKQSTFTHSVKRIEARSLDEDVDRRWHEQ